MSRLRDELRRIDSKRLDEMVAPEDNTDLDATTDRHGLLPKLDGNTAKFLRADGSWEPPSGGTSLPVVLRVVSLGF